MVGLVGLEPTKETAFEAVGCANSPTPQTYVEFGTRPQIRTEKHLSLNQGSVPIPQAGHMV